MSLQRQARMENTDLKRLQHYLVHSLNSQSKKHPTQLHKIDHDAFSWVVLFRQASGISKIKLLFI